MLRLDKETDFLGDVFKIAFGVALGGLLIWAAIEYRARYELAQAAAAISAAAEANKSALEQASQQRAENQRLQHLRDIEEQRESTVRRQTAVREHHRKLAAWNDFYQPSADCLATVSVECGNAHMRARREFERRYLAGEFPEAM